MAIERESRRDRPELSGYDGNDSHNAKSREASPEMAQFLSDQEPRNETRRHKRQLGTVALCRKVASCYFKTSGQPVKISPDKNQRLASR